MTEANKAEVPKFRVTAGTFATGLHLYQPGEEIDWEVPEGWNEAKYGKHFAAHGPSVSFECLNQAAVDMMEGHKAKIKRNSVPPLSDLAEMKKMVATLVEQNMQLMQTLLAQQAEARRAADEGEKGKKK